MKTMEIKLERTIPAPAAEVFDAWLDPNVPVNPFSGSKKLVFDLKEMLLQVLLGAFKLGFQQMCLLDGTDGGILRVGAIVDSTHLGRWSERQC